MSVHWSDACTSALQAHEAAGVIHTQIAFLLNEEFGTNYNRSSVGKKLIRLRGFKPSAIFWPENIKARLTQMYNWVTPVSFTDMAIHLNEEFGTAYSRCAVIAQTKRLGLSGKTHASSKNTRVRLPSKPRVPRIRVVSANGNSTRKRVIEAAPSREITALRCVEIVPLHLTLMDLERGNCRYPYGGDRDGDPITFCGHPKAEGSSYCIPHFHLTRGPGTSSERAAHKVSRMVAA